MSDVMVSKLNNDRKPGEGAGQAIGRIYGKIGFTGLWNGLPVRIFMIGTLTAFQWLIYDSFKVYLGVSSSFSPSTARSVALCIVIELTCYSCLRLEDTEISLLPLFERNIVVAIPILALNHVWCWGAKT
jgi:hypothetical protein